jgi:transposase InsO family protein
MSSSFEHLRSKSPEYGINIVDDGDLKPFVRRPTIPKICRLTYKEETDYSIGAAMPVFEENLKPEEVLIASMGHWVIGPGESLSVPIKVVYGSKIKKARANLDECILHMDRFCASMGTELPYLTKRRNVIKHGFIINNNTEKVRVIPDSTRLAHAEFTSVKPAFGIARLTAYCRYQNTGKCYVPATETYRCAMNAAFNKFNRPTWEPEDYERLDSMFAYMQRSKWWKDIPKDERLYERLEHIDKLVNFPPNSPLNETQQFQVKMLIMCHCDRVCLDIEDLPNANVPPMRINTHNHPPIKLKMRPTPIHCREHLHAEIEELVRGKIITPVIDSGYGFPLVIVPKPDGKFRTCIDFRELNAVTVVNQGPIPLLQDMIANVKDMEFMASLDLTKAYWQLPLHPDDWEKTTIICEEGTFMYMKVPFGLAGAVAHYQTILRDIIKKCQKGEGQSIGNYIDDVFIGGKTFEGFLDMLEKFLKQLRIANLKIGLKKSSFGVREVKYLGFIATKDTWYPDPERIKPILDRPPPDDLKQLRGICSALAFYKRFLPNCAKILEPLYEKLRGLTAEYAKKSRKPIKIELDERVIKAWEECKKLLQSKIMNWHIDPFKEFHLFVDASDTASGSAIMQYYEQELRPVAFHSRVFTQAERRYTATERELLGVIHALDKYYYIIVNGPIIHVYTDHKAIIALVAAKTPTTPRLCRWRRWLSTYHLKWQHIPGKDHELADFLSRPPAEVYRKMQAYIEREPTEEYFEYDSRFPRLHLCRLIASTFGLTINATYQDGDIDKLISSYSLEIDNISLLEEQRRDEKCLEIAKYLSDKDFKTKALDDLAGDKLAIFARRCLIIKEVLCCYTDIGGLRIIPVIPKSMVKSVIETAHADRMGHLRNPRLKQLIAANCDWPTMSADIDKALRECSVCTNFLGGRHFEPPPAAFVAEKFLDQITIDVFHLGPSKHNFTKALAVIDTFTRFGWVVPIKDETAETQIEALRASLMTLGWPKSIIADRATAYISETFKSFTKSHGITLYLSPGYSPNHVALVNRFHRTLREMLAKTANQIADWVDALQYVVLAYNCTSHPALGFAPREVLIGENGRLMLNQMIGVTIRPADIERADYITDLHIARSEIKAKVQKVQKDLQAESMKKYLKTRSSKKPHILRKGDRVLRVCLADKKKLGKQAAVRYFGPYIVVEILQDGVHANIVREIDPESKVEQIHIKNLVLAKDRVCVPIYPAADIIERENTLVHPNTPPVDGGARFAPPALSAHVPHVLSHTVPVYSFSPNDPGFSNTYNFRLLTQLDHQLTTSDQLRYDDKEGRQEYCPRGQ